MAVAEGTSGSIVEAMLLTAFRVGERGNLDGPGAETLLEVTRQAAGGEYSVELRRYGGPRRQALVRFKEEADPKGVLGAALS